MKKLLTTLALCGSIVFVGCHKENKEVPDAEKTYLDWVMKDYHSLAASYPDAKDHFVEAQFVMDGIISEMNPDNIKAASATTICYLFQQGYSDIFMAERDFSTGQVEQFNYTADTPWVGDSQIPEEDLNKFTITLEDAIRLALNDAEAKASDGLDTKYVTLRKSVWPVWPHAQYVIGGYSGRKIHVFVDAVDGTVTCKETPVEEGSAAAFLIDDYAVMKDVFGYQDEIMGYYVNISDRLTEAQYVLNANVNAKPVSELFTKEVNYLFYVPGATPDGKDVLAKGYRDFTAGRMASLEISWDILDAPWTGDLYIDSIDMDNLIPIEDAISSLKLSKYTDTDTPYVTLRWPDITPALEHPQYVFTGDKTKTIYVDAFTAEVREAK